MSTNITPTPPSDQPTKTSKRQCDGCGRIPTAADRMLRCSRCRQTIYCNRSCQIQHYPQHKELCRRVSSSAMPLFKCEVISEEKGRGLIALRHLRRGQRLDTRVGVEDYRFPSVLYQDQRRLRCAYCFCSLSSSSSSNNRGGNVGEYDDFHRHCSETCRKLDVHSARETNGMMMMKKKAQSAANRMIFPSPPSTLTLFVSRILYDMREAASSSISCNDSRRQVYDAVDSLATNFENFCGCKEKYYIIFSGALQWLQYLETGFVRNVKDENKSFYKRVQCNDYGVELVAKVMMNCFTITDGIEPSLGISLFCRIASMVNHSCFPNTIQTFDIQRNEPPQVILTICRDVAVSMID